MFTCLKNLPRKIFKSYSTFLFNIPYQPYLEGLNSFSNSAVPNKFENIFSDAYELVNVEIENDAVAR